MNAKKGRVTGEQLGELQVSIYWLHDSCQFEQLANMASVIYQNLGFDRALADKVGRIISECYQVADQAQDLYLKGDCEEEEAAYFLAAEKLKQAERILEYKKSVAVHQVRWWAHFRHRENIRAIYHLFAQNLQEVSIKGLFEAGKLTYNLVRVGFAHNRRDRADAIRYASEYWNILLRSLRKRNDLSYLG